jgi:site-specific DNA-methyltransferase (cytosine-N4-specific)
METEKDNMSFIKAKKDNATYLTHNFHPYPAKFIPQIPKSIIKEFTNEKDVVLDPFCGSGTTLIEAKLLNRNAVGVDINPIATLISKAKTSKISLEQMDKIRNLLSQIKKDIENYYNHTNISIGHIIPTFRGIDHWFEKNVIYELAIIKAYIDTVSDENLKNYLYTAFSAIIVNVSNQESEIRYAAIKKDIKPFQPFIMFSKKLENMNIRMLEFSKKASDAQVTVFTADARYMDFLMDNSVDLILTSPPYANTYDYYLYHKFRIYWLGYDVKYVQNNEIGSRNRHSSKKEDVSSFIDDLSKCLTEMSRVLKNKKYAVIIIGDSVIRGEFIKMDEVVKEVAAKKNFRFVKEINHNLTESSKMFNPKFAKKDKLEHIMYFQNVKDGT